MPTLKETIKQTPVGKVLADEYWRMKRRGKRVVNRFSPRIPRSIKNQRRLNTYLRLHASDIKIHLGCGPIHLNDWLNVDLLDFKSVDWIHAITDLHPLPDNSATMLYAAHVLEHFPTDEIPAILAEWNRVIRPGGMIRLSVPDLDVITKVYQDNLAWFDPPHNPWLGIIYGGQKDQYDFHKTGYNFRWMRGLLQDAGFTNVVQTEPKEMAPGMRDASFVREPFGVYFSLCVEAIKP